MKNINHIARAAEKFSNTACFIASIPSYEHKPCLERKALHIFLLRYAKVFSSLFSDSLIFLQKIIFCWSVKCAIDDSLATWLECIGVIVVGDYTSSTYRKIFKVYDWWIPEFSHPI